MLKKLKENKLLLGILIGLIIITFGYYLVNVVQFGYDKNVQKEEEYDKLMNSIQN